MIEVLKGLQDALVEETRLERELAAVGARKRDALVALDLPVVDQSTTREQQLIGMVGVAAERRLRRTAETARLLGVADGEASVSRIAERAGEPWKTALSAEAERLRAARRDVQRIHSANRALTQQSLVSVKQFFRALGGGGEEATYTRRGMESRAGAPQVMIDRVV